MPTGGSNTVSPFFMKGGEYRGNRDKRDQPVLFSDEDHRAVLIRQFTKKIPSETRGRPTIKE